MRASLAGLSKAVHRHAFALFQVSSQTRPQWSPPSQLLPAPVAAAFGTAASKAGPGRVYNLSAQPMHRRLINTGLSSDAMREARGRGHICDMVCPGFMHAAEM